MVISISTSDKGEARTLLDAQKYKNVLAEVDEWLRSAVKYQDKPYQEVRDELYRILGEWNVSLEDDLEPTEESGCACGRAPAPDGDGSDGRDGPDAGPVGVGAR